MLRLAMAKGVPITGSDDDLSFRVTWDGGRTFHFELRGVDPGDRIAILRPGMEPQPVTRIGRSASFRAAMLYPRHCFSWSKADGRHYRIIGRIKPNGASFVGNPSLAFEIPGSCLVMRADANLKVVRIREHLEEPSRHEPRPDSAPVSLRMGLRISNPERTPA